MNPQPGGTQPQPHGQRPRVVLAFSAGDAVPGLSSWLLERQLGGGGFGSVWLVRHALNKYAPRAVKFCTDPAARHRLVTHEKNVVARVMQHAGDHPNIVPFLEYNLDGDVPWLIAPNTKMRFCYIPAGECQLGSPKTESQRYADEDEDKRGIVRTNGFWLGKYEVTQSEWAAVIRDRTLISPSEFRVDGTRARELGTLKDTSRFPVENVSWDNCQEYLKRTNAYRVSQGDNGGFDLPHEDEWEYACRGGLGNKRPFHFGDLLNGTQANCDGNFPFGKSAKGNNLKRPQPVGSYEAKARHPWGLCDMHGNVWEWCKNSDPKAGDRRVVRSGSWSN
jgi:formylglycine-generating enzyme required for sulfatase activity